MKIITKKDIIDDEFFYFNEIKLGKIFVYPTDTIYGIGCDAKNSNSILKIRKIKKRESKPFSIIVPSKNWIYDNCKITDNAINWFNKLPGPYTFILELINKNNIAKEEIIGNAKNIAVRIPDNWFSNFISKNNICFITTSVNITGENPISKLSDLNNELKLQIDYFIDEGILNKKPSKIVDLTEREVKIIRE